MPEGTTKKITVSVDAELHAEIKAYLESHEMTMGEFIALAAEDELHPKIQEKESKSMENMRTLAFQVPEDLFQRIKDYLRRNDMTQKQFVIGLIEDELERDEALLQGNSDEKSEEDSVEQGEDEPSPTTSDADSGEADVSESNEVQDDFSDEDPAAISADDFEADEGEDEPEEEDLDHGPEM